jgi:protein AbiQ
VRSCNDKGEKAFFSPLCLGGKMDLHLYMVKSAYIDYLRSDPQLIHVYDNKEDTSVYGRKYLGIVLEFPEYKYFVPLSSEKPSDYDLTGKIRKDIIPIMRIISTDNHGNPELKGTIRFSSMIPVPDDSLINYDIAKETDPDYKILVQKEYEFIRANKERIIKNAQVLYTQKTKDDSFYVGKVKPNYLKSTIDFQYAEKKCIAYKPT